MAESSPTPESPAAPLYNFEEVHGRAGHRDALQARQQLKVLWARLQGTTEQLDELEQHDPTGWQFLMRYIADGPLSIQWYDAKRPELEAKQRRYNGLILGMALLLFVLAFALPFQPLLLTLFDSNLKLADVTAHTGLVDVAALMGVVGTGATVALRMSAQVVRYRRQAAVFHKASASLKEQLYRLESDWACRPVLDPDAEDTRLHPEFTAGLRQAVGQAQSILADERDAYFDTLIVDVNALTDNTTQATTDLAGSLPFRSDRRHERGEARLGLDAQISEARLGVQTAQAKIEVLEAELAVASEDMKIDLQLLIRDQRMALQEAEQKQRHLERERSKIFGG